MDTAALMSAFNMAQDGFGDYTNLMGQAGMLEINAGANDINAKKEIASGDFAARRIEESGARYLSKQRMGYAKAGVRLEGSPLEALAMSARNIRMDITMTKLNAADRANAYGFQALQQRIAAGQARTRAITAMGQALTKSVAQIGMASGGGGSTSVPKGGVGVGSSGSMVTSQRRGNTIYDSTTVR